MSQVNDDNSNLVNKSEENLQSQVIQSMRRPSPDSSDFAIIWQNLTYKVDSRSWYSRTNERLFKFTRRTDMQGLDNVPLCEKTVLNGICGDVKSRQLTGILGPSGAGKSSLLYCLFQNRTIGTTGRILVDAEGKKRLKVCFIPQKDYLNEFLTVREDLIFVSKLRSATIRTEVSDANVQESTSEFSRNGADGRFPGSTYVTQNGRNSTTTLIDHNANALRVADLLGITNCLDVRIKNISGGQRKRLSIARELMSKPDILIMDEPTTGLDSLTCQKTMVVLRDLAHNSSHPMAVIVTIHQPQRSVFNLLDKAYFLSNRGQVVYSDSPTKVAETLETITGLNIPAAKYNPASVLIDLSSEQSNKGTIDLLINHQRSKFESEYSENHLKRLMQNKYDSPSWKFCTMNGRKSSLSDDILVMQQIRKNAAEQMSTATLSMDTDNINTPTINTKGDLYYISHQLRDCLSSHKNNNFIRIMRHIAILTHRSWLSVIRNPTHTKSRLLFHTTLPLIMLMIFGTTSGSPNGCPLIGAELKLSDMQKSVEDSVVKKNVDETRLAFENISFFFILIYGFSINIISSTASHYPLTIQMFKKETINGLYSPGPYFIGQLLAELPLEILYPSISVILGYSLSGQVSSYLEWRMFGVTLMVVLICYTVHSLGLLCGAIFVNNINVAVLVGQVSLFPAILLSGFIIRPSRMSDIMLKLSALSYYKHALQGMVAARYGFNLCDCDDETLPEDGKAIRFASVPQNVKHVLDYMFPDTNETNGIVVSEMFDKLSERFIKAQTFALDMKTCEDVKPYAMTAFGVTDSSILTGSIAMLAMTVVIKSITFSVVRVAPYRLD